MLTFLFGWIIGGTDRDRRAKRPGTVMGRAVAGVAVVALVLFLLGAVLYALLGVAGLIVLALLILWPVALIVRAVRQGPRVTRG